MCAISEHQSCQHLGYKLKLEMKANKNDHTEEQSKKMFLSCVSFIKFKVEEHNFSEAEVNQTETKTTSL